MTGNEQMDFCLLIPCYNNFTGLIDSLKSVHYSKDKFHVIVVDDGSNSSFTEKDIYQQSDFDFQVAVIRNEKNEGITNALNKGLEWIEKNSTAEYIARLDCGDVCDPQRFFIQIAYLKDHPGVGLLGSWCVFEEKNTSNKYVYRMPKNENAIRRIMYFKNAFIHSTIIFKRSLLSKSGYYLSNFPYTEDYAFCWKLMNITGVAILDKLLVIYEINRKGLSFSHRRKQLWGRWKVVAAFGSNPFLKIMGFIRICILFIIPKRLALYLKK